MHASSSAIDAERAVASGAGWLGALALTTAFLVLIVAVWGQSFHSESIDLGLHYALAEHIATTGAPPRELLPNLSEMSFYPPIAHIVAAGLGVLLGSTAAGLAALALVAVALSYLMLVDLLRADRMAETLAGVGVFLLIILVLKDRLFIGREIVSNFYFAQIVGFCTALAIVRLLAGLRHRPALRAAVTIGATFVCGWLFTMAAIQLAAMMVAFQLLRLLEIRSGGDGRLGREALVLGILLAGLPAVIVLHPVFLFMLKVADHNGSISAGVRIYGFLLIAALTGLALFAAVRRHIAGRLALRHGTVLLAVAGGTLAAGLAQAAACAIGYGSVYAILKHSFPITTMLAALIGVLAAPAVAARLGPYLGSYGLRWPSALPVPPVGMLVAILFVIPIEDRRPIPVFNAHRDFADRMLRDRLPEDAGQRALMQSPWLDHNENFAISAGDIGLRKETAWWRIYGEGKPPPFPDAGHPVDFIFTSPEGQPADCVLARAEGIDLVLVDARCTEGRVAAPRAGG